MMIGPIAEVRHSFGVAKTDNLLGLTQIAVAMRFEGSGRKRITHIVATVGPTTAVLLGFDVVTKLIVFQGGHINKAEPTDLVNAAFTLYPVSQGDLMFENALIPTSGNLYQSAHVFIDEDIIETQDGEAINVVLLARSAIIPPYLRLFVNGCVTLISP